MLLDEIYNFSYSLAMEQLCTQPGWCGATITDEIHLQSDTVEAKEAL